MGEPKFFKELCESALADVKSNENNNTHVELLKISEAFYQEFKKTNSQECKHISALFRRVANMAYRELRKNNRTRYHHNFLNLVK